MSAKYPVILETGNRSQYDSLAGPNRSGAWVMRDRGVRAARNNGPFAADEILVKKHPIDFFF